MIRLYPPTRKQEVCLLNDEVVVVPNQSMSLAQILQKFTKGERIDVSTKDTYYDDSGNADLEKQYNDDLTEIQERYIQARNVYDDLQKAEQDKIKAAEKEKYDAAINAIVEQRLSEKRSSQKAEGT